MLERKFSRRAFLKAGGLGIAGAALFGAAGCGGGQQSNAGGAVGSGDGRESENQGGNTMSTNPQDGSRPTVVLVHGAFADASSWNGVVELLQQEGVRVTAPANPLRGISIDST